MKTIIVTVAPNGQTQIAADGFTGNECRTFTAFLHDGLGQIEQEQLTPAYFEAEAHLASQQERQT